MTQMLKNYTNRMEKNLLKVAGRQISEQVDFFSDIGRNIKSITPNYTVNIKHPIFAVPLTACVGAAEN